MNPVIGLLRRSEYNVWAPSHPSVYLGGCATRGRDFSVHYWCLLLRFMPEV